MKVSGGMIKKIRGLRDEVVGSGHIDVREPRFQEGEGVEGDRVFRLPPWALRMHMYVIGGSGKGKSTMLKNLIKGLREAKYPAAIHVIDPHGDMAEELLYIDPDPSSIVYLDILETQYVLNPLELPPYRSEEERDILVEIKIGEMMKVMEELFGVTLQKAPRLSWILQTVLRYLYARSDTPTFSELYHVIMALRRKDMALLLEMERLLKDQQALKESMVFMQKLPSDAFAAALNKLQAFSTSKLLKRTFSRRKSTVNMEELIQPGKLVIWRFSKASLPPQVLELGMSAVALALWFAVLARAKEKKYGERTPVLLFIDEFQNLQNLSLLPILLSESRKYQLLLTLVHQNLKQLSDELIASVLANTATQILFGISGDDASRIASMIDPEKRDEIRHDLTNMPRYIALIRLRPRDPTEPYLLYRVRMFPPPEPVRGEVEVKKVKEEMRRRYAAPEEEEEEMVIEEAQFLQLIDLEQLPDPKEYAILNEIDLGGENAYVKAIAEKLGLSRADVSKQIRKMTEKGLIRLKEERKVRRGRVKIFMVTGAGKKVLRSWLNIRKVAPSEVGRKIAEEAIIYYRKQGYLVLTPKQSGSFQPDFIAIPVSPEWTWDLENAVSIEIESPREVENEPGQVKRNVEKIIPLGLRIVDVWCRLEDVEKVKKIVKEAHISAEIRVRGQKIEI